jgi:Uma2 family endonuclease
LYARAGIAEYWVVDAQGRRVFEYREPGPVGYGRVRCVEGEEELRPLEEGKAAVRVGELLG